MSHLPRLHNIRSPKSPTRADLETGDRTRANMPLHSGNGYPEPSGAVVNITNGINIMSPRHHPLSNRISQQFNLPGG
jgi:hypothetical protein